MKTKFTLRVSALIAAATLVSVSTLSAEPGKDDPKPKPSEPAKPGKTAVKPYPLETCIVSDEKLGSMGKPVTFEHKGQEIKLCCKSCRKDFDKEPEKFLKKIEDKPKK